MSILSRLYFNAALQQWHWLQLHPLVTAHCSTSTSRVYIILLLLVKPKNVFPEIDKPIYRTAVPFKPMKYLVITYLNAMRG